jgi:hypothetical protein
LALSAPAITQSPLALSGDTLLTSREKCVMSNAFAPFGFAESHRELEPLLAKHAEGQRMLGCGSAHYWRLVKERKIIAVGKGRASRILVPSIRAYVAELVENAPAVRATLLLPGTRKDGVRVRRATAARIVDVAEPRRNKAHRGLVE